MSRLAAQQRDFLAAILQAESPGEPGLAVYRRNVLGARQGALSAAYPVTRRLVGDAFFDEAAERFAHATPSTRGDLNAYGEAFAGFIASYPHARALPCLPDVARLEWAVHESHAAADGALLDVAALARVPGEALAGLVVRLHPAVRLVRSAHPVLAIWEANQPSRDGTPAGDTGPDRVLVRREVHAVVPVAVEEDEWRVLRAFAQGHTLDAACAALGEAEARFPAVLARLAALGALGGFEAAA
jgi:hypothetical protein